MKGKPYIAVVLSMIFWSFSFVWFKIANRDYDPITIVFIRLILSALFLSTFLFLSKGFTPIAKADRRYFFLLALCEPFLYFLGESFGLTYVSPTTGSVIISTIPVFAVIAAWIFYRERMGLINYTGVIISFAGVVVFITTGTGNITMDPRGLALLLLAVVSAVGYNMVLHRLASRYNPVMIVNTQNIIGSLLFLPFFLIFDMHKFASTGFIAGSFTAVVLLAVFASSGAFVLFAYSVQKIGITKANIFCNLIPVFTALFALLLMKESITARNLIGMALVITGLFLSQTTKRKQTVTDIDMAGRSA